MINWIAINMIHSYPVSLKEVKHVISHHLYYSMCQKCLPPAWMQVRRHWHNSPRARSVAVWLRVAHSLLVYYLSSATYNL